MSDDDMNASVRPPGGSALRRPRTPLRAPSQRCLIGSGTAACCSSERYRRTDPHARILARSPPGIVVTVRVLPVYCSNRSNIAPGAEPRRLPDRRRVSRDFRNARPYSLATVGVSAENSEVSEVTLSDIETGSFAFCCRYSSMPGQCSMASSTRGSLPRA